VPAFPGATGTNGRPPGADDWLLPRPVAHAYRMRLPEGATCQEEANGQFLLLRKIGVTHAICITIPYRVAKEPIWKQSAWFTRQDLAALPGAGLVKASDARLVWRRAQRWVPQSAGRD
jgi:hypothetical protein